MLRALGVIQDHAMVEVAGHIAVRAQDSPRSQSPVAFSLWQHALEPLSPPASWAWPRALAGSQGVAYDEAVVDDPDWELILRLGELVGVSALEAVTSVHREWATTDAHVPDSTGRTAQEVIDARPLVIPPGEAARMRAGGTQTAIVRRLGEKLELKREQLQLTHDHAANLEGIVRHLEGRVSQLEERAAQADARHAQAERRHAKQVARLRRKLDAARADPTDAEGQARGRSWRPRRREQ